jgi:hypothetical protein
MTVAMNPSYFLTCRNICKNIDLFYDCINLVYATSGCSGVIYRFETKETSCNIFSLLIVTPCSTTFFKVVILPVIQLLIPNTQIRSIINSRGSQLYAGKFKSANHCSSTRITCMQKQMDGGF